MQTNKYKTCEGCSYFRIQKTRCRVILDYSDYIEGCPCRSCLVKPICTLSQCQIFINWIGTEVDKKFSKYVKEIQ